MYFEKTISKDNLFTFFTQSFKKIVRNNWNNWWNWKQVEALQYLKPSQKLTTKDIFSEGQSTTTIRNSKIFC